MTTFARPGQAQPKQQSQGSPYNPQGGSGFQAWNPQNFQKAMQGGGNTYSAGMNDSQRTQAQTAWAQPKQQLLDWGAQAPRPEPMQAMPAMNQFGQLPNQNLNSIMQQRQALVQQINNAQSQQQVGTWLGQGAPPDNWGQMQFNPQQMWQNANQMVNQGWQNPLSQPGQARPSQQPSFGTPYNPQGGQPAPRPAQPAPQPPRSNDWLPAPTVDADGRPIMHQAVMVPWYNERTGETTDRTAGVTPRPGSGWVAGSGPSQPQPSQQPSFGTPYNPQGGQPSKQPRMPMGQLDLSYDPGYQQWRNGLITDMRARTPAENAAREQGFMEQYARERTPAVPNQPRPSAPSQYDDLFKQFGFSPPPGFMDALIQRLGGQQGGVWTTFPQPGGPRNTMPGFPDPGGQPQPSRPQRPQTVRERVEAEKQAYKERMQTPQGGQSPTLPQPGGPSYPMPGFPGPGGQPQPSFPGFPQPPGGQPSLPGFPSPGFPPGGPMPGWPQWPQLPNVGGYPPPPPTPNRNAPRPIG